MSKFGDLLGGKKAPTPAPAPIVEPVVEQPVVEEVVEESTTEEKIVETLQYESDVSFRDMSKNELEEYGRTVGIELDRRHSRSRLIRELESFLADL